MNGRPFTTKTKQPAECEFARLVVFARELVEPWMDGRWGETVEPLDRLIAIALRVREVRPISLPLLVLPALYPGRGSEIIPTTIERAVRDEAAIDSPDSARRRLVSAAHMVARMACEENGCPDRLDGAIGRLAIELRRFDELANAKEQRVA